MQIYELEIDELRYRVTTDDGCYVVLRVADNRRIGRILLRREADGALGTWLDRGDAVLDRIARELVDHGWASLPDDG